MLPGPWCAAPAWEPFLDWCGCGSWTPQLHLLPAHLQAQVQSRSSHSWLGMEAGRQLLCAGTLVLQKCTIMDVVTMTVDRWEQWQ